jgi:uncharacterized membrane protein YdjX (TVP38/TMEM64 family)
MTTGGAGQLSTTATKTASTHRHWRSVLLKLVAAAVALVTILILARLFRDAIPTAETFIYELGFWGPAVFIVAFVIGTSLWVPESVFAIGAGVIFGMWGLIWVVAAGIIGSLLIFALSRSILTGRIDGLVAAHPRIHSILEAAGTQGVRLLTLLRLSFLNYALLNYLLPTTKVRLGVYTISLLGMVPGNAMTVYLGFAGRHVAAVSSDMVSTTVAKELSIYLGLAATIVVSAIIARMAHHAISQLTPECPPE